MAKPNLKLNDSFKRDEHGLLKGIEYVFRDNSTIDWRAMVKSEYIVFNLQYKSEVEAKYQKRIEDVKVEEVEDKYLLILLAGMKELAFIRGYESVTYRVHEAHKRYAAVSCRIRWIPNYETNNRCLTFESLADASIETTSGFAQNYLMAMAENRAFVRCVRNSLGIHIVGVDEIGPKTNGHFGAPPKSLPQGMLYQILEEKKIPFPRFKDEWVSMGHEEAKGWNAIEEVPSDQVFVILEAMKKVKK
jgi:hypothetical protein